MKFFYKFIFLTLAVQPVIAQQHPEESIPIITNTKLSDMTGWTIKLRNNAATGDPEDKLITELTEDLTPDSTDWVITGLNADGELKKSQIGNLPITDTNTNIFNTNDSLTASRDLDIAGFDLLIKDGAQSRLLVSDTVGTIITAPNGTSAIDVTNTGITLNGTITNPLSSFAATTSAQFAGVILDETGTGAAVLATNPVLVTPNLGTPSALVGTNITGLGAGAGALLDSEVTNLAQVKAFDTTDYATSAQGAAADAALPTAGGTMTGQIVADNLGVEFEDSDTNPSCAAGNYSVFADLSETTLKKCVNGTITDLDTSGGTVDPTSDFSPIGNAGEQLTVNEAETAMEFALASKYLSVRKGSAGTITAGTPVYISGYNVGQSSIEVEEADADNSAAMPAVGLAFDSITNAANTRAILLGSTEGLVDTSAWTVGDAIYVSTAVGTLTNVKPTGTAAIQKIGTVARSSASSGQLTIVGAGRSNDVPNYSAADKFRYGGATGTTTEADITSFGRSIVDDADASAVRTTINAEQADANILKAPDNEVITGDYDFSGGGIEIENGTTPPACTTGQIYLDTDATSGQQLYACEAGTFVLQGDGSGGGGGNLTTKGDLEVYTTSQTRLAVGTNDQVLTADSTAAAGVAWKDAAGGSYWTEVEVTSDQEWTNTSTVDSVLKFTPSANTTYEIEAVLILLNSNSSAAYCYVQPGWPTGLDWGAVQWTWTESDSSEYDVPARHFDDADSTGYWAVESDCFSTTKPTISKISGFIRAGSSPSGDWVIRGKALNTSTSYYWKLKAGSVLRYRAV